MVRRVCEKFNGDGVNFGDVFGYINLSLMDSRLTVSALPTSMRLSIRDSLGVFERLSVVVIVSVSVVLSLRGDARGGVTAVDAAAISKFI